MRTDLSYGKFSRIYRLDYKKVILIIFLARIIFACAYDIFVFISDRDVLLPDSRYYSITGQYVALLLKGYDKGSITTDILPKDWHGREIFFNALKDTRLSGIHFSNFFKEEYLFFYIVGIIYFLIGYFPIFIRVFNIVMSMASVYLFFRISRRHFGELAANLFLLAALLSPTHFFYSAMLSKDILRLFIMTVILWGIYG